jgi:hypothetical protein
VITIILPKLFEAQGLLRVHKNIQAIYVKICSQSNIVFLNSTLFMLNYQYLKTEILKKYLLPEDVIIISASLSVHSSGHGLSYVICSR